MGKEIYHSSLKSLDGSVLDITSSATPGRYRLFDCDQFVNHKQLRISEFTDISKIKYAAISYVWKGTPVDAASKAMDKLGRFAVKGAEEADKISIDVLLQVCKAALQEHVHYLCMDRIGMMQTSDDDKHWQIQHMHGIYKGCDICFVLPGGIRRLVSLDTPTPWIHRGWTLQEVMAPKRAKVIFLWRHGEIISSQGTAPFTMNQVTPYECGMTDLDSIFNTSVGSATVTTKGGHKFSIKTKILGSSDAHVYALMGAMGEKNSSTRAQAIWRSALMRTSSRPVDMIFSIMGLFGVTLNVKSFKANERIAATIALAQKISENGERASWLGPSYFLPPAKMLSAFPTFPKTSEAGKAYVEIDGVDKPVEKVMEDTACWMKGLPKGSIDGEGYFNFRAKGVSLLPTTHRSSHPESANSKITKGDERPHLTAMDGSVWHIDPRGKDTSSHRHYAIYLGTLENYRNGSLASYEDASPIRVLLVQHHGIGKVHRKSYFIVGKVFESLIDKWHNHDFSLGGPL